MPERKLRFFVQALNSLEKGIYMNSFGKEEKNESNFILSKNDHLRFVKPEVLEKKIYSGIEINTLYSYCNQYGSTEHFFDNIDIPQEVLTNELFWTNYNVIYQIFQNYRTLCLDDFVLYDGYNVGFHSIIDNQWGLNDQLLTTLPIKMILKQAEKFSDYISKIDILSPLDIRSNTGFISYTMKKPFFSFFLDSSFVPMIRGMIDALPTKKGWSAGESIELASCMDMVTILHRDYSRQGYRLEEEKSGIYIIGPDKEKKKIGTIIDIYDTPDIEYVVRHTLKGKKGIISELDINGISNEGRKFPIIKQGTIYPHKGSFEISIIKESWKEPRFPAIKALFNGGYKGFIEYLGYQFREKDYLIRLAEQKQSTLSELIETIENLKNEQVSNLRATIDANFRLGEVYHQLQDRTEHDLNNLLFAISCNADIGIMNIKNFANKPDHISSILESFRNIQEAVQNSTTILHEIKIISDPNSSKKIEFVSIPDGINNIVSNASSYFSGTNCIDLDIKIIKPVNYKSNTLLESNDLLSILRNLVGNSIDALEKVKNPKIIISYWDDGESTYFSIHDNGSGFNNPRKAIEKGFTTKPITPKQGSYVKGTGRGMAIVKEIIEKYGGNMYIDSVPKNTSVIIEIPNNWVRSTSKFLKEYELSKWNGVRP